jgi:hypothetical protein
VDAIAANPDAEAQDLGQRTILPSNFSGSSCNIIQHFQDALVVMTLIVSLPFNQVFKVIVPHLTVQDLLNLVFLFAIDECQWWRRGQSMAWDLVWDGDGQCIN